MRIKKSLWARLRFGLRIVGLFFSLMIHLTACAGSSSHAKPDAIPSPVHALSSDEALRFKKLLTSLGQVTDLGSRLSQEHGSAKAAMMARVLAEITSTTTSNPNGTVPVDPNVGPNQGAPNPLQQSIDNGDCSIQSTLPDGQPTELKAGEQTLPEFHVEVVGASCPMKYSLSLLGQQNQNGFDATFALSFDAISAEAKKLSDVDHAVYQGTFHVALAQTTTPAGSGQTINVSIALDAQGHSQTEGDFKGQNENSGQINIVIAGATPTGLTRRLASARGWKSLVATTSFGAPSAGMPPGGFPSGFPTGFPSGAPGTAPGGFPSGFPAGFPGGMPGATPGDAPGGFPTGFPTGAPGAGMPSTPGNAGGMPMGFPGLSITGQMSERDVYQTPSFTGELFSQMGFNGMQPNIVYKLNGQPITESEYNSYHDLLKIPGMKTMGVGGQTDPGNAGGGSFPGAWPGSDGGAPQVLSCKVEIFTEAIGSFPPARTIQSCGRSEQKSDSVGDSQINVQFTASGSYTSVETTVCNGAGTDCSKAERDFLPNETKSFDDQIGSLVVRSSCQAVPDCGGQ